MQRCISNKCKCLNDDTYMFSKLELLIPCISSRIFILTNNNQVVKLVENIYPCKFSTEEVDHLIIIKSENDTYQIEYCEDRYINISLNDVIFILIEIIEDVVESLLEESNKVTFHGGLIHRDGRTFGLIAKSNMGKSTLIMELSYYGYEYLSDDIIVINNKNYDVMPYQRLIKLRNTKQFKIDISDRIVTQGSSMIRSEYLYLVKSFCYGRNSSCKLSSIIILNRGVERVFQYKLSKSTAYKELIENSKFPNKKSIIRTNTFSLNMVRDLPVHKFNYNNTQDVVFLLDSIYQEDITNE